MSSIKDF
jgi:hypothetical protein